MRAAVWLLHGWWSARSLSTEYCLDYELHKGEDIHRNQADAAIASSAAGAQCPLALQAVILFCLAFSVGWAVDSALGICVSVLSLAMFTFRHLYVHLVPSSTRIRRVWSAYNRVEQRMSD